MSDVPLKSKIGVSTANDHSKLMNWQQLQASADGTAARFACVVDPWHKDVKVDAHARRAGQGDDHGERAGHRTTRGNGRRPRASSTAATWQGSRNGGFRMTVDAETAVPPTP